MLVDGADLELLEVAAICVGAGGFALALIGGALADAFDRRKLIFGAELASALISVALLVNALLPSPQLWVLYVAAALFAAASSVLRPPLDALLPRLVERDELKAATAISWSLSSLAQIAGPALAGVIIAAAGVSTAYAIDIGSTFAQFKILTPYPGTPMFKQLEPLLSEADWEKYDGFTPTFKHPNLTNRELRFLLGAAYKRYYMRPSYLANFLKIQNGAIREWVSRMDRRVSARHSREEIADVSRPVAC